MVFYFWQNMPAMHQVPYQRELVAMGHRVTLCVDRLMLPEREAMGWQPEDTSGMTVHVGLDLIAARRLMKESPAEAIHLISGVRGVNHGGELTLFAHKLGRRVCWICETWDHRGFKGAVRSLIYRLETFRYRPCLEKIFAMGDMGAADYRRVGFSAEQVSAFNYVVAHAPALAARENPSRPFTFGYVGALIPRKRVDLLIHSLAILVAARSDIVLEIHGDGTSLPQLRAQSEKLGVEKRIRWQGRFASSEAMNRISRLDAMVLPSDFDGWGAVVNEALLCGVPVVVSDACGASCLPARHGWGAVFRAGDANACAQACLQVMTHPPAVDPVEVDALIGARATAQRLIRELSHDQTSH